MHDLYMPTGRVYHTMHGYGDEDMARMYASHPLYTRVIEMPAYTHLFMSASTAGDQLRFEIGAVETGVCREHNNPRAEKLTRLNKEHGWWDDYARHSKRWHGSRARGPRNRVEYPTGRVYEGVLHAQWSFVSWKDNGRPYQAHGRVRGAIG